MSDFKAEREPLCQLQRASEPTTQLVSYNENPPDYHMMPSWQFEGGTKATAFNGRLDGTLATLMRAGCECIYASI